MFERLVTDAEYTARVFYSYSRLLALEECRGDWRPVVDRLALQDPDQESIDSLAENFRKHVQPLERARGTRQKLETSWNSVVTWAAARDGLKLLLPMSESTLQALLGTRSAWAALFRCSRVWCMLFRPGTGTLGFPSPFTGTANTSV